MNMESENQDSKPIEFDFPVTDYYKNHILDGTTLTHSGAWWSAILLINEPKSHKPFIALYRWQKTADGWKTRKRFSFKRFKEAKQAMEIVGKFAEKLHEAE